MKKPNRKTPSPCTPDWVHPLEHKIQREIFAYELARRTPTGRARGWPRWDNVEPQIGLALSRALIVSPRNPVTFAPANKYTKLSYPDAWAGEGARRDVFFNLSRPIDELVEHFRRIVSNLRSELGVVEVPPPSRKTQSVPWSWLEIIDADRVLSDSERSLKAKALAIGLTHVSSVIDCFSDPKKVIRAFDLRNKPKG